MDILTNTSLLFTLHGCMGLDDPLGCEWLLDEQVDLHNVILGVLENQPLKRCLFCVIPYVGDLDLS